MKWLKLCAFYVFWGVLWVVVWVFEHVLGVKCKSEVYGTFAVMAIVAAAILAVLVVGVGILIWRVLA
jgi:hypothetical protein